MTRIEISAAARGEAYSDTILRLASEMEAA